MESSNLPKDGKASGKATPKTKKRLFSGFSAGSQAEQAKGFGMPAEQGTKLAAERGLYSSSFKSFGAHIQEATKSCVDVKSLLKSRQDH